jgi:hypothetical protein
MGLRGATQNSDGFAEFAMVELTAVMNIKDLADSAPSTLLAIRPNRKGNQRSVKYRTDGAPQVTDSQSRLER